MNAIKRAGEIAAHEEEVIAALRAVRVDPPLSLDECEARAVGFHKAAQHVAFARLELEKLRSCPWTVPARLLEERLEKAAVEWRLVWHERRDAERAELEAPVQAGPSAVSECPHANSSLDRDKAIALIRTALKRRSGKAWSVTGGRGTAWGWIRIDAPPARRIWRHVPKPGFDEHSAPPGKDGWTEAPTGKPGGHTGPQERAELAKLLGLERVHEQGESIPSAGDYRHEYVDRAEGRTPCVHGTPYWD